MKFRNLLFSMAILFMSGFLMAQDELTGKIILIQSATPGAGERLLDTDGNTLGKNGGKVQLWQDDATHAHIHQKWKLIASDKGESLYHIITLSTNAGKFKYLDASFDDLGKNGCSIRLWEDNGGTDNQLWKITKNENGTYRIASAHPNAQGRSLDADGYTQGKNGGKIQLWQFTEGNPNQEWNLILLK